ncbi:MAG: DUF892 family protein [Planctomycetota bacterium]
MGLFTSEKFESIEDLLVHQLKDLYDAKHRVVDKYPEMAKEAECDKLKEAFDKHLAQSRKHIATLEEVFSKLGFEPERVTCDAMQGLISETDSALALGGDCCVKDAAIIAAAQRIEHYEIAGYGCTRTFARKAGHPGVAEMLQSILDDDYTADERLTEVAVDHVNVAAATA